MATIEEITTETERFTTIQNAINAVETQKMNCHFGLSLDDIMNPDAGLAYLESMEKTSKEEFEILNVRLRLLHKLRNASFQQLKRWGVFGSESFNADEGEKVIAWVKCHLTNRKVEVEATRDAETKALYERLQTKEKNETCRLEKMYWVARVGDGVNFKNSSKYGIWGEKRANKFVPGDKLIFVQSGTDCKVIAIATFERLKERVDTGMTNETLGWRGGGEGMSTWRWEIHYTDLYFLEIRDIHIIPKGGQNPFVRYDVSELPVTLADILE
jgi:hypothetical protein